MKRPLLLALLFVAAGWARLGAQGSPPMITDDPGTPGDGHWEISLGWTTERTPGSTATGLPQLDASYGVGSRIELSYQTPWAIVHDDAGTRAGWGDSTAGMKWRFQGGGDDDPGWKASVYPQVTFLNPGSHSDRRGLADSATTFLLPVECEKQLGPIGMDFEFGHVFGPAEAGGGWTGGIVFGYRVTKAWELDAEVHGNTSESLGRAEWTENFGVQVDLSDDVTLMGAIGRDLSNQLGPRVSLLSYLGVQLRL